ncbi:hypothetical protein NLJ89_g6111 [Agrocybe chaxingu]|uniref:Histone chaperone domain-containing protein n=1 Tax=Agrocybe chaxingu TaxID=84603 RepID=A0A9W8K727_9AGAR|nr:hypothetical protein NLJ89_g6111 [Agrocybe chaxingu]
MYGFETELGVFEDDKNPARTSGSPAPEQQIAPSSGRKSEACLARARIELETPPPPLGGTASPSGKGKAKAADVSMEEEEDDDEEEEGDEDEAMGTDEEDEDEEEEYEEIDPSAIVGRRTRGVKVDYTSKEALEKAGLQGNELDEDEEDADVQMKH